MEHGQNNTPLKAEIWNSSKHLQKTMVTHSSAVPGLINYLHYQGFNDFGFCKATSLRKSKLLPFLLL